jgi:hypothetical protein
MGYSANSQNNNRMEVCWSAIDQIGARFYLHMLISFFGKNAHYLREMNVFFPKEPKNNRNYFARNSFARPVP